MKTKKREKQVMDFLQEMQSLFNLNNFDRIIEYKKENHATEAWAASVFVQEDYQRIKINLYPCFWEESHNNQARYLLHELCHSLSEPITEVARLLLEGKLVTERERVFAMEKGVSATANLIEKLLEDKANYAKIAYNKFKKRE